MVSRFLIGIGVLALLSACQSKPKDAASYRQWMADPANGLNIIKQTSVFEFSLQYLPTEYRVLKAIEDEATLTKDDRDSLYASMHQSLYFIFTISPREGRAAGDVMYSGVNDYPDYKQRVQALNFGIKDYWSLRTEAGEFAPVLSNLENTYSLTDYRKLHIVFAPPDSTVHFHDLKPWDVVFNDEVFGTGVSHFVY